MSRPAIAVLVLFIVAAAWFGVPEYLKKTQKVDPQRAAAEERFLETVTEIQEQTIRGFQAGDLAVQAETLQRMQGAVETAGKAYGGTEGQAMVTLGRVLKEIAEKLMALANAQKNVEELFDFTSLKERALLASRQQRAEVLANANEEYAQYLERYGTRLRMLLAEQGIDKATIEKFVALTEEGVAETRPLQLRIRRYEIDLARALVEKFKLLEKEWGRWSVSKNNIITFQSEGSGKAFDLLTQVTNRATAGQQAAQQELVEVMKRK